MIGKLKKISTLLSIITIIIFLKPKLAQAACPSGTSDYGTITNCATKCTTSCDGSCCDIANNGGSGVFAGDEVTKDVIDSLNPLIQQNSDPSLAVELSTPGGVVSRFLGGYAFPIAGLILFVMLIWGGVEMMVGSATSKSVDAGKQRVTAAIAGFLLLFASYWIAQILELMFGIKIL